MWLHVGGGTPGSHVVVRQPEGGEVPRAVVKRAAELAAKHSKAGKASGKVDVHVCRACDVRKPRGAKAGSVELRRYESVKVYPGGAVAVTRPGSPRLRGGGRAGGRGGRCARP